jgi:hypothetical protein
MVTIHIRLRCDFFISPSLLAETSANNEKFEKKNLPDVIIIVVWCFDCLFYRVGGINLFFKMKVTGFFSIFFFSRSHMLVLSKNVSLSKKKRFSRNI